MEGFGPDAVDEEELKRAKLWRDIRAELLTRGVKPSWDGNSTRNTREWAKASLEQQKLAQKIVPGAVHHYLRGKLTGYR